MIFKKSLIWLGGCWLAAVMLATTANAACLDFSALKPAAWRPQPSLLAPGLVTALYHPDGPSGAHWTNADFRDFFPPTIAGLWKFRFSPEMGGDFGTIIWHDDGTEVMLSAARDPAAGQVCMGVWKQTGRFTYEWTHIAMGHDGPPGGPPSPTFSVIVHIHGFLRLDPSGNSLAGQVSAVIAAANPANPFDESAVFAQPSGTITATRVTP